VAILQLYKTGAVPHIHRPMAILSILLSTIIIATSIIIVLIVLIQRPKQEGLGAAFGGGTLDSALGAHTTDVLQKITMYLGIVFFVSAIGLAMVKSRQFRSSAAEGVLDGVENREPAAPSLPPALTTPPIDTSTPDTTLPDPSEPVPVTPGASLLDDIVIPDPATPAAGGDDAASKGSSKEDAKSAPKGAAPAGGEKGEGSGN